MVGVNLGYQDRYETKMTFHVVEADKFVVLASESDAGVVAVDCADYGQTCVSSDVEFAANRSFDCRELVAEEEQAVHSDHFSSSTTIVEC